MSRSITDVFLISATAAIVITAPLTAASMTRLRHFSGCFVPSGANTSPGTTLDVSTIIGGGQLGNTSTKNALELYCPILDDDLLPKSAVARVTLAGFDGSTSGGFFAQVCTAFQQGGGAGERCGMA